MILNRNTFFTFLLARDYVSSLCSEILYIHTHICSRTERKGEASSLTIVERIKELVLVLENGSLRRVVGKKRSNGQSGSDNTLDELIRCRLRRRSLDSSRVLRQSSPPHRLLSLSSIPHGLSASLPILGPDGNEPT